uniref:DUF2345 domain-containing protein n=1 Tax=Pantoea endophytica TaxID=92488 RepID=UPI001FD77209
AHKEKLSLIAGQGAIKVEAQNAAMKITAAKKLSMSAEQDITFAGKKRIVLIGGGSYLKLEAGRIEYGTEAKYLRKIKRTHKAVAREMPVEIPVMPLADRFAQHAANRILLPVIRLGDSPGINGQVNSQRRWQIVPAGSSSEAMSTDDVLMSGISGEQGLVLTSKEQQAELTELAQRYSDCLWLVTGQRAHRLRFNVIPADASEEIKDACAQNTMGYHHDFGAIKGSAAPGTALTQCVRAEQNTGAPLLPPLTEE